MAKVLAGFLGLKASGSVAQGMAVANQRLQHEFGIEYSRLPLLSQAALEAYLTERNLTAAQAETLSEYMKEIALTTTGNEARTHLTTALHLLSVADTLSGTLSFDRIDRKSKLEAMLQRVG